MIVDLDFRSPDSYRQFLAIRRLPRYGYLGTRRMIVPDEYVHLIGINGRRTDRKKSKREYSAEYYRKNRHRWKKRSPEKQAEYNAKRREQYAKDPEMQKQYRESAKRWKKENPEKGLDQDLRVYGIDAVRYREMLADQNGRCAICRREPGKHSRGTRLHVDHDHLSGNVRGLLCGRCNLGIGKFEEKVDLFLQAILYLHQHKLNGIESSTTTLLESASIDDSEEALPVDEVAPATEPKKRGRKPKAKVAEPDKGSMVDPMPMSYAASDGVAPDDGLVQPSFWDSLAPGAEPLTGEDLLNDWERRNGLPVNHAAEADAFDELVNAAVPSSESDPLDSIDDDLADLF